MPKLPPSVQLADRYGLADGCVLVTVFHAGSPAVVEYSTLKPVSGKPARPSKASIRACTEVETSICVSLIELPLELSVVKLASAGGVRSVTNEKVSDHGPVLLSVVRERTCQ